MYRLIEELNAKGESEWRVYGVLADYDLSSWRKDLENDYTRTSQQRTGTPPYMAFELLQRTSSTHLYRHDLESLFYIILLMAAHHTITPTESGRNAKLKGRVVMREGELPYQKWFDTPDYDTLGSIKESFFSGKRKQPIELSPAFEAFRPWLNGMRRGFAKGFNSKNQDSTTDEELNSGEEQVGRSVSDATTSAPVPFDDETLGGRVGYSTVIKPTHRLKGELKGLVIRYDIEASVV